MLSDRLHATLTDTGTTDPGEARRFSVHFVALTLTKIADGLINPKIVLAWLLTTLGAPGYIVGALVPVRESGALLPQLLLARRIQRAQRRKGFWAVGSLVQGAAALGMAAAALLTSGAVAGWSILGCLAVLAVARSACSASHKDVLARTVEKGTRGALSGAAGTIGAVAVFAFAAALATGTIPRETTSIALVIGVAGVLWLVAGSVFSTLDEDPDEAASDTRTTLAALVEPLRDDPEFRTYIVTRGLMIATALAPPFLILMSGQRREGGEAVALGPLMIASASATIASSYVWGRISDRSSRRTLMASGLLAALTLGGAAVAGWAGGGLGIWAASAFLFVAQVAYEGTRSGRKIHLTDMDTGGRKTIYTALSNTLIGVLLIAGGGFGLLADAFGPAAVLAVFAVMAASGAGVASRLSEVQSMEREST